MEIITHSNSSKLLLDRIIWFSFIVWLIIDDLTGFFINAGKPLPISQTFKFGLLIILIFRLSTFKRQFIILYSFLTYIAFISLHLIFIDENVPITLLHLSKLLLTVIIYLYFVKYIQISSTQDFITKSNTILYISFLIIAINIGLGLFGIGYHTYPDEGIGYKGFFFAGNEMGGLLVVIFPYILYRTFIKYGHIRYCIMCTICIALSILLGTKTVILISLLSSICVGWLYGSAKFRRNLIFSITIIVTVSLPYFINLINSREVDILMRMSYSFDNGGLSSLIFSSRDEFWAKKSIEFFNSDAVTQMFGLGGNRSVEMDHLDSLLNYGYFGLTVIYGFFLYLLLHALKHRHNNSYCPIIILTDILLISISLIAGHIIFSSMAGMYIALQNSLTNIKANQSILI